MMKRLVTFLFFTTLLLLAAALIAPGFINWNNHKELIIAQLEPYVTRKIGVAGDVHFSILPNPRLSLEQVSVGDLLKLKTLEAKVRLKPLLEGKFEVEAINLVEPDLTLEIAEDGTAQWQGVFTEGGAPAVSKVSPASILLKQVTLSNGKLRYVNKMTGAEWNIEQLNLRIAADTLLGPYRVAGDMLYDGKPINIEIGSGKYDRASPVPLRATFMPVEGLPEIKLNGVADLKTGFDMQGELSIEQGTLASLFDSAFLRDIYFLNDVADLRGVLEIKGGDIRLTDIKAKIGQKGVFSGKIEAKLEKGRKPVITADLDGADLKIYGKDGYLPGPANFDLRLKMKGKRLTWNTLSIPSASVAADGTAREWVIKDMTVEMPGKSVFRMSGLATPKDKTASLTLDLSAEDLSQVIVGVPFKKIGLQGNLDLGPEKISIYNFQATANEGEKFAGVINVDRKAERFAGDVVLSGSIAGLEDFTLKGKLIDTALTGDVSAKKVDFSVLRDADMDLTVRAKTLVWRSDEITDADFKVEEAAGGITKISGLKGRLWDGDLQADAEGSDSGPGTLKGTLTNADLDKLRVLLELDGFNLGRGDIQFDFRDDGSRDKMFHSISGEFKVKTGVLTVDKFDLSQLKKLLDQLQAPPENLKELIRKSLRGGDGVFTDIEAVFKVGRGKFTFEDVKLANDDADIKLKGEYDLGPEKYDVTADVKPREDIPAFAIKAPGYEFDDAAFRDYIARNRPAEAVPMEEPVPAEPAVEEQAPPVEEETPAPEEDPLKGVIDRLDAPEELETQEVEPVAPAEPVQENAVEPEADEEPAVIEEEPAVIEEEPEEAPAVP